MRAEREGRGFDARDRERAKERFDFGVFAGRKRVVDAGVRRGGEEITLGVLLRRFRRRRGDEEGF